MTALLLSVVLVSGYLFVINALPTRYKFKRSEGWGAYFFVAAWGIFFFILGWGLCSVLGVAGLTGKTALWVGLSKDNLSSLTPLSGNATHIKQELKIAMWVVTSTGLAFISGLLVRLRYCTQNSKLKAIAKEATNNPLEELLIESVSTLFPVITTLKSKKVYVGWVRYPVLEHGKIEYLSLIPLMSGYRDKDKLTVKMTTNYWEHYEDSGIFNGINELTINNFRVVLPISDVENISLFDIDTYKTFQKKEDKKNKKGLMDLIRRKK